MIPISLPSFRVSVYHDGCIGRKHYYRDLNKAYEYLMCLLENSEFYNYSVCVKVEERKGIKWTVLSAFYQESAMVKAIRARGHKNDEEVA